MSEFSTENPASSLDVAGAVTNLVAATVRSLEVVEGAEEPGKKIHAVPEVSDAEAALAVALETWLGTEQQFLSATVVSGLAEPLTRRLRGTHAELHQQDTHLGQAGS